MKTLKHVLLLSLMLIVSILSLSACGEDHEEIIPEVKPSDNVALEISPTTTSFGPGKDSVTFTVTTNASWTVSADDTSWLEFNKTKGTGNGTFVITVLRNTNTQLRETFIHVKSSINGMAKTLSFNICQLGRESGADGTGFNGHDYVDLGLKDEQGRTIYWATCNVGADKPEEPGLYFAWGETEGYGSNTNDGRVFNRASYKWCRGSNDTMTKYCTDSYYGTVDNKTVLEPADDAATQNWGGDWRMPTKAELVQLLTYCTWTWNSTNIGYTVTGPNGKSIFLPAAGYRYASFLLDAGSYGYYWSSSLDTSSLIGAYSLIFGSGVVDWSSSSRYRGLSVRAVCVSIE